MKKIALYVFLAALISSCASTKQYASYSESVKPEKARIVLYRTSNLGSAIKFKVYSNDQLVGKIGHKSYLAWDVEANQKLKVLLDCEGDDFIFIDVEAGKTYYLEAEPKMGIMSAGCGLQLIGSDIGDDVLRGLKMPKRG